MRGWLLVVLAVLAFPAASAERAEADPIRRALKDIPPAGLSCPIPQPGARAGGGLPATAKAPADFGCAVGVERAAQLIANPQTVLVDTRRKQAYDAFRINGAMNLPEDDLVTLPHLKARPVVLLGSGKGERTLYEACARLKRDGFRQVHVLRGGINAWTQAGREVIGQAPAVLDRVWLTPAELNYEATVPENLVLRTPDVDAAKHGLTRAGVLKQVTPAGAKAAVAQAKASRKGKPVGAIVLVLGDKADRAQLGSLLAAVGTDPVLVYGEPMSAYAQHLADQKAMWLAQAQGPKAPACTP